MIRILVLMAVVASGDAKLQSTSVEPRQIAENAMKRVVADDMAGLFQIITKNMPGGQGLDKIRESIETQRKNARQVMGPGLGFGLVSECRRSDYLVRYVFAEKRANSVYRWQFIFYKARNAWSLLLFFTDQDMPGLFEQCASSV